MRNSRVIRFMAVAVAGWSGATAAAEVKVAPYGLTKDGRPVKSYTLVNDHGASATILDYGGAVAAIRVPDRNGVLGNTVMSFADLAGWEALGHANSIIGRFANRITRGFTLDGVHYPLQQDARGVTMHGGPPGYATRVWTVAPIRRRDGAAVTLTLDSRDGDQGFPGRVRVTATYRFTNDNALRLDFAATTDKPTVINLTNHIYFNLGGNSTTPVSGHDMQVMTDQAAVLEPGSPPTGEIRSVTGTPLDFTRPTVLAERLAITLGPQFDSADNAPAIPAGMARSFNIPYLLHAGDNRLNRIAARLHDPVSGRIMELRTTEMSVHVFTPAVVRAGLLSDAGKPFTRVPSIAFETQHLPDSPNRPEFPSTVLRPGRTFRSTTIFGFSVDKASASVPAVAATVSPPDFSGVWAMRFVEYVRTEAGKLPPMKPEALANYQARVARMEAGQQVPDSATACLPHGMPRIMYTPYPVHILQRPELVAFLFEVNHNVRLAYFNRKLPADPDPAYMGYSVAHWEDATLVVETSGLNDKIQIDRAGLPESTATRIVERLRLVEGGRKLENRITVTDDTLYTAPWSFVVQYTKSNDDIMEYVCENNRAIFPTGK